LVVVPIDFGLKVVAAALPCSNLAAHRLDAVDAPAQALAPFMTLISISAMFSQLPCFGCEQTRIGPHSAHFEERNASCNGERVGFQVVVHHQRDALGVRIAFSDVPARTQPSQFGSALGDLGQAYRPAARWLNVHTPQRSYS
jgi:hypothetical protein